MTKPLGYYVDAHSALASLESEFGSTLHLLSQSEKLHLLSVLAMREQQVEDGDTPDDYSVTAAYDDYPFEGTAHVFHSAEILDLLPSRQTRGLILALANQVNQP